MEKYIRKINDKLDAKNDIEHARKVKKRFQTIGGIILATGLAGFVALFVAFMILFAVCHLILLRGLNYPMPKVNLLL